MPFTKHSRQYDVVVFGATGYTGLRTAEFIAEHFPTDTRWAVAGRSAQKLEDVVKTCQELHPDRKAPQVEVCALNDTDLAALAKKTFILIATIGPYHLHGEHAFKACAEAGTHYLDCTGEAVWHAEMIRKYHDTAKASGACMFPQSGVESAPSDLVTFALASRIREELSVPIGDVVVSLHELRSAPSGGTLATFLGLFENYSFKEIEKSHKPYALSPVPNPKSAPASSIVSKLTGAHHIPNLGLQAPSITSGTDAAVVQRSWGLFQQEPVLRKYAYGPGFTFREFAKTRNVLSAFFMQYSLLIGGALLALLPPVRYLIKKFIFQPGQGPSREDSAKDYIEYRGVATPDVQPPSGQQALCRAWYSGSMYLLTAAFLAEAAHTLLEDDLGLAGGCYTPACLGQGFIDRMDEAGFKIETKMIKQ
ncbi:Saccharopine dehydrogenase-domain-containing protein [Xylariaceae sp. FL0594]|nr:Saccharopine dehydrogenase-domain-containing protein [Xylariaceae sp. FL0594]